MNAHPNDISNATGLWVWYMGHEDGEGYDDDASSGGSDSPGQDGNDQRSIGLTITKDASVRFMTGGKMRDSMFRHDNLVSGSTRYDILFSMSMSRSWDTDSKAAYDLRISRRYHLPPDQGFDGVVIKLGKDFSKISILPNKVIIAGSALTDKKVAEFASENEVGGLEFLSCIPGSVGGGIRMNSGCFGKEFKDILLSVQAIDRNGKVLTIPSSKILFEYRKNNLPKDLIFLSASFKGDFKKKEDSIKYIEILKKEKEKAQPTKVKTGGSTFKNPIDQTQEKVWKLIKSSVPNNISFGDATISEKHSNFFVNKKNASYKDMKKLIDFVKMNVKKKKNINLDLEIEIVG
mgnify:CR=1 FL=1